MTATDSAQRDPDEADPHATHPDAGHPDTGHPDAAHADEGRPDGAARVAGEGAGWAPDRLVLIATRLVVAIGAALRIRQWVYGRAFWLDELLLVRAMSEQRIGQVLRPLRLDQSAPPGWLAVQHLVLDHSSGERAARVLPMVFGIGTVVLTALLARAVLGPVAALAATALVALSTQLITYSSEFKQYSSDAFWLQLVLLLGIRLALRRGHPTRGRYALGAVAAAAVWFSHATTLGVAGVFLALGLQALAGRRWRELAVLVGCAVPAGAGLAVQYVTLLSANAADPVLRVYWSAAFRPDGRLTWATGWDWFTGRTRSVTVDPLLWDYGWPLAVLAGAGLAVLLLRRPRAVPVLALPLAAIVVAGLLGSYPIANRLALWAVPLAALLVAAPLDLPLLARRLPAVPAARGLAGGSRVVAVGVAVVLALAAAAQLVRMSAGQVRTDAGSVAEPRQYEESRTLLGQVAAQRRPGDLVLVGSAAGRYSADYYGPEVGLGPYWLLDSRPRGPGCRPAWFGTQLWQSRVYRRIWLVTSHQGPSRVLIEQLRRFGPAAAELHQRGADAIRFDRSPIPVPVARPPDQCVLMTSG